MARTSLTVEHIARIEGHGNVSLSIDARYKIGRAHV